MCYKKLRKVFAPPPNPKNAPAALCIALCAIVL